jgi:branched-chain amino acid transport system permease protein
MELFLMTLITGILVGGIYALVALGWVLIYKCSGVLNLAMGELTLIGAYVSLTFYTMGMPFVLAVVCTLMVGIALGFLTERIFLDKLIGEPILAVIMVTVGLVLFFKGLVGFIWGTDTRVFTPPVFSATPITIGFCQDVFSVSLVFYPFHRSSSYFCRILQVHPLGPFHAGHRGR